MTNILRLPLITLAATTWSNGEWADQILFEDNGVPLDLSGISFAWQQRRQAAAYANQLALSASTSNGLLVNGGLSGILSFAVPVDAMAAMMPDLYVGNFIAIADGHTRNLSGPDGPSVITHKLGV